MGRGPQDFIDAAARQNDFAVLAAGSAEVLQITPTFPRPISHRAMPGAPQGDDAARVSRGIAEQAGLRRRRLALANALRQQGKLDDAISNYRDYVQARPAGIQRPCEPGRCLDGQGRFRWGHARIRGALRRNRILPTSISILPWHSKACSIDRALQEFEAYLQLAPNASDDEQIRKHLKEIAAAQNKK